MSERRNVYFGAIHHGEPEQGRDYLLYASLYDRKTHDLLISADIDYILEAIEERDYYVVRRPLDGEK